MTPRTLASLSLGALSLLFVLRSAHALDGGVADASSPIAAPAMDASSATDASSDREAGDPTLRPARCSAGISLAYLQIQREVVLDCPQDFRECSGTIEVRVEHCGTGVARLHTVTLLSANVTGYGTYPVVVTPGESRAMLVAFHSSGAAQSTSVLARLTHADGRESISSVQVVFRNPARDRAQRQCRACRGDWGRHGMLGYGSCICRTRDAGRRCTDGRDCEGICLQTGTERVVTRRCRTRDCIEEYGMRAVGRCSEFVGQFGCHTYIPDGARDRRPTLGLEIHSACAD